TPLAAVVITPEDSSGGPSVVAVERAPATIHVAVGSLSAPPPALMVYSPGALQIPTMALSAYRNAERKMSVETPNCGVSWNLLAGIGRIESLHANGGATDARGTAIQPILGPVLDGTLPGNEIIVASSGPGRVSYARAVGPMQFLPGTWSRYASDGDGDGKADPQNLFDATLAAARYLCSGELNLRETPQVLTSILRYNNSTAYARNVLGWAAAYATGVVPVDLPAIVGPPPPIADVRLETPGPDPLGSGSLVNTHGLLPTDPMTNRPLIDLSSPPDSRPWWQSPSRLPGRSQNCTLICIESQELPPPNPFAPPNAVAPAPPPDALPPPAEPLPAYAVAPAPPPPPSGSEPPAAPPS
ncbi:MAG TPA: lytic murein transglycosylase, partial [Mycobacterium sp.]|nr:lytic murein transglycosylase [Mycobacterium sp.]